MTRRPIRIPTLAALCCGAILAQTVAFVTPVLAQTGYSPPAAVSRAAYAPTYSPYSCCPPAPQVVRPAQPIPAQPQPAQPQPTQPQPNQPQPTQPQPDQPQPEPQPSTDNDLSERSGAVGGESVAIATPGVIGDLNGNGPTFGMQTTSGSRRVVKIPTAVASGSFKISENESVRPTDRIIFTFNYFSDVNGSFNARQGGLVGKVDIHRELIGFEKTFLDGQASIGMRLPLNTLSAGAGSSDPGGTFTDVGDLTIIGKYMFWTSEDRRSLASGGLSLTVPTGPDNFAGSNDQLSSFHSVLVQPWLGYLYDNGTFYAQGFTSVAVPLDTNDVTFLFNDIAVGVYAYKNQSSDSYIKYLAPTFEAHVNTPLSNRGLFSGPNGQADVVDLTEGVHIGIGRRGVLTLGVCEPVTGPRPFDIEGLAQFNYRF